MKYIFFTLSVLFIFFFTSCNYNGKQLIESNLKSFIGKEIIFSNELLIDSLLENNYLLISYIDSMDCTPCSLQRVQTFRVNNTRLKDVNTNILLIVRDTNELIVHEILERMHIDFPVVFDKRGVFKSQNKLFDDAKYQDFVIDKSHKVIWLGSPFKDIDSWDLYNEMIQVKRNIDALQ